MLERRGKVAIVGVDHWIAFTLLSVVGLRMIWESLHIGTDSQKTPDISRTPVLLTLAIATSVDAVAVGVSFAFVTVNIWLASMLIGVFASLATAIAFGVGTKIGSLAGRYIGVVGGIMVISIGVRILLTHIL